MRTNNGKTLCNDCGTKIPKINGYKLMATKHHETYCFKCYRKHYSEEELNELDAKLTKGFQHNILGIPTPQDVAHFKLVPVEQTLAYDGGNHEYQCR
ncbi:hypothetical protein [Rhodococcus sp. IEGM 1318]|uniref:hypothetical protein n=1 Tax=Rhodococcus sp. IEGM 1318 TaxID=3082226 RepID=UPI002954733C|nr:hypothetical protein [Rhodococcus sp. IEGM 1318]MDV8003846.1 hypothetical protein [Rhodococcus sp. IEGM 1318]